MNVLEVMDDAAGKLPDSECAPLIEARAAVAELIEALQSVVKLADEIHELWDNDQDSKVGKYLLALSGHLPNYDSRVTAIHAAIKKASP